MGQHPQHHLHRIDPCEEVGRVLVVEDNPVTADVVQFYLERVGYQVSVAHDGCEALRMLDAGRFDLIVTDYRMPRMDGRELCLKMRQHDRYARAPVIMVTARNGELDVPNLRRELGLIGVFAKPFSPTALVRAIKDCLKAR